MGEGGKLRDERRPAGSLGREGEPPRGSSVIFVGACDGGPAGDPAEVPLYSPQLRRSVGRSDSAITSSGSSSVSTASRAARALGTVEK